MAKCPKEENTNLNTIDQGSLPICGLVTIANNIKYQTGLPIDIEKFILCLDSNDSDTEQKKLLFNQRPFINLKKTDRTRYITTVKLYNLLLSPKNIALPINYDFLCNKDKLITLDNIEFKRLFENQKESTDLCKECSFLADFDIKFLREQRPRNLCEVLCLFGPSSYSINHPHIDWLLSLLNKPYDPDDIPLYDYTENKPQTQMENLKDCVFTGIHSSEGVKPTELSKFLSDKEPVIIESFENHELKKNDIVWFFGPPNLDPRVAFPFPAFIAASSQGGISANVLEVLSDKSFKIAVLNHNAIASAKGGQPYVFAAKNPEIYKDRIFKFKKVSSLHVAIVVDCEYSNNTYIFTMINSWGLNKSYKTKFKIYGTQELFSYTYSFLNYSGIHNFRISGDIKKSDGTKLQSIPSKDANWNTNAPKEDLVDTCGYCKYACGEFGYSPPGGTEDKDLTYGNLNCLELGFDALLYNPFRPHQCRCVCDEGKVHNGTTCVPKIGAWCTQTQCADGQFYITGCKTGNYFEWLAEKGFGKAGDFIEDGTCPQTDDSNFITDIECIIETPEDCDEDPYEDIYDD
jgi:hypothetical protein